MAIESAATGATESVASEASGGTESAASEASGGTESVASEATEVTESVGGIEGNALRRALTIPGKCSPRQAGLAWSRVHTRDHPLLMAVAR